MSEVGPQADGKGQTEVEISVVVPFYNAEKHIEECARALLAQSYPPSRYEIIMVDNNSTDSSASLVRKYPRIKLLSEDKQGSYAARNRGVTESSGAIIAFTDADCVPSPDWLDKISASLRSSEVGLVQGGRRYAMESPALSMLADYESERAAHTFSDKSIGVYYGYTNNMAVRRDLFDRCGPFLEIIRGADSIFLNRVVEEYSAEAVCYAPDAYIYHLEIRSVWGYFRKRFIYGGSLQQNYSIRKGKHRKLFLAEISEILNGTINRKGYSLLQSLCFIILTFLGEFSFGLGRLNVRLSDTMKRSIRRR